LGLAIVGGFCWARQPDPTLVSSSCELGRPPKTIPIPTHQQHQVNNILPHHSPSTTVHLLRPSLTTSQSQIYIPLSFSSQPTHIISRWLLRYVLLLHSLSLSLSPPQDSCLALPDDSPFPPSLACNPRRVSRSGSERQRRTLNVCLRLDVSFRIPCILFTLSFARKC
jgi:hypothetical protein